MYLLKITLGRTNTLTQASVAPTLTIQPPITGLETAWLEYTPRMSENCFRGVAFERDHAGEGSVESSQFRERDRGSVQVQLTSCGDNRGSR